MDDSTKSLIALVVAIIGFVSLVLGLVYLDHRQVHEMTEQGYVWVPATPGHYEKK